MISEFQSDHTYIYWIAKSFQEHGLELDMAQKLKDEMRILSAQLVNVQFTYRDPEKNFDRSRVKGVVAKLIKVKDCSTMTSLEVGNSWHETVCLPSRTLFICQ